MTGPAAGKFPLKARVFFLSGDKRKKVEDAMVYIHLKGYARARVTHLDIEHKALGKLIHRGKGNFLDIEGVRGGSSSVPKSRCKSSFSGGKSQFKGSLSSAPS